VSAPSGNTWHGLSWPGLELNRFYLEILGSRRVTRNRELLKLLPWIASLVAVLAIGVSPLRKGSVEKRDSCLRNLAGSRAGHESQRQAADDSTQAPTVQLSAPPFLCSSIQRRV